MFDRPAWSSDCEGGAGTATVAGAVDRSPTLLRIGGLDDDNNAALMAAIARGAGLRSLGSTRWADAGARLDMMIGVDVLILDLQGESRDEAALERLLRPVIGWPSTSDARLIVLADLAQINAVDAALFGLHAETLCDAGPGELALALCHAVAGLRATGSLHDVGRDGESHRLEMLSDEVRRLAQTIDRLAMREGHALDGRSAPSAAAPPPPHYHAQDSDRPLSGDQPERRGAVVTSAEIRALLQVRRLRDRYMPADLFADPAWDMMLDLMAARLDGKRVSVSSLCIAAAVPPTTALRWIGQLTERGIFVRTRDPQDARRVFIELSDESAENVAAWFAAARRDGLRLGQRRGG